MQPNGIILPQGRNDFSCNVNNDSDVIPSDPGGTGGSGSGGGGDSDVPPEGEAPPGPGVPNPPDPAGQAPGPEICGVVTGTMPGDELEVCEEACEGQYNQWYVCDDEPTLGASDTIPASCKKISEGEGAKLIVSPEESGKRVLVVSRCPDPASPDGYGPPQISPPTGRIGGDGPNYWGPFVSGSLRVIFDGYQGAWEVPVGVNGWYMYSRLSPSGNSLQYWVYSINASGEYTNLTCVPREVFTMNCQAVLIGTNVRFDLNGEPYTPPGSSV
jgi:hypothetical protein